MKKLKIYTNRRNFFDFILLYAEFLFFNHKLSEGGDIFCAELINGEIQGGSQTVNPQRLRYTHACESRPIRDKRGRKALRAAAQINYDDGDYKSVDKHGESSAEDNAQNMVFNKSADYQSAYYGYQRRRRAYWNVVGKKGGAEVCKQTPDYEGGRRFRIKQRQYGQRFGGAYLHKSLVAYCAESVGERNVQRGYNCRAAQSFRGKKFLHKIIFKGAAEKTVPFSFGFFSDVFIRKPSYILIFF